MKVLRRIFATLAVAAVSLTLGVGNAKATGPVLFDDFDTLTAVNPDLGGNWWVLNTGLNGGFYYVYNDFCGDGTCVLPKSEDGVTYAALEQYTTQVPGNYYNAELAELHTGYVYGQPTQWNPEAGHPVVMEARVRWSENYQANGSGGAIGSAGIWLWNSPIDYINFTGYPQDGIGFQWVDEGSSFAPGLRMGVVDDSFPVFQMPLMSVDMQEWNTFRVEWGVSPTGMQYVDLYINGSYRGHHPLLSPLSDLSVEVWSDNQKPVDRVGTIVVTPPTSTQSMDVDYINIEKL